MVYKRRKDLVTSMPIEALVVLVVSAIGMFTSWSGWVSITLFKHREEIALIKQERKLLFDLKVDLKEILSDIRVQLHN